MSIVYRAAKGSRLTIADFDANMSHLQNSKVDKIPGKGLSTNDFTDHYRHHLEQLITRLNLGELEPFEPRIAGLVDDNNVALGPLWGQPPVTHQTRLLSIVDNPVRPIAGLTLPDQTGAWSTSAGGYSNLFVDGDAIIIGGNRGSGASTPSNFLVSTDGGQTFSVTPSMGSLVRYDGVGAAAGALFFRSSGTSVVFRVSLNGGNTLHAPTGVTEATLAACFQVVRSQDDSRFVAMSANGTVHFSSDGLAWLSGTARTMTNVNSFHRFGNGQLWGLGATSAGVALVSTSGATSTQTNVAGISVGGAISIQVFDDTAFIRNTAGVSVTSATTPATPSTIAAWLSVPSGTNVLPIVKTSTGGFIASTSNGVYRTPELGGVWTRTEVINVGAVFDAGNGVLVSANRYLSTDDGVTWAFNTSIPAAGGFFKNRGLIVCRDFNTRESFFTSNGLDWVSVVSDHLITMNDDALAQDARSGIILQQGAGGNMLCSIDGGITAVVVSRPAVFSQSGMWGFLPVPTTSGHFRFVVRETQEKARVCEINPAALRVTLDLT
jgi:hypothetical protein